VRGQAPAGCVALAPTGAPQGRGHPPPHRVHDPPAAARAGAAGLTGVVLATVRQGARLRGMAAPLSAVMESSEPASARYNWGE
jgi:hypothetical protein